LIRRDPAQNKRDAEDEEEEPDADDKAVVVRWCVGSMSDMVVMMILMIDGMISVARRERSVAGRSNPK